MEKIIRPEEFGKTLPLTSIICEEVEYVNNKNWEYDHSDPFSEIRDKIATKCDSEGEYQVKINIGKETFSYEGRMKTAVYSILEGRHSDYHGYYYNETDRVELTFEEFQRLGRPMQLRRETVHTYTAILKTQTNNQQLKGGK